MVTVLNRRRHGFDVRIYPDDHEPPHVHVWKGGRQVKIDLETMEVISASHKFNSREIGQIVKLLLEHESLLLSVWKRLSIS
ncbi:MAG: DUF4160 domain-containing protein [Chloroflexota bacterium]|nr:DUF4160 domain-containing protein [Chloroflexota bacterium]MDE2854885.1 DUF4160 domain-containing protein [Chloroflexota bacterium]MDE2947458.1 DUF4160 domain-containing protein [Chloroflexota bacterium]